MSKRKVSARPRRRAPLRTKRRRRSVVVIAVVLSLSLAGGILAQWQSIPIPRALHAWLSPRPQSPAPVVPPSMPSKEYIYAGGKLVATEEPLPCNKSIQQFIQDFYEGALNRQPTAAELQSWNSALTQAYPQGTAAVLAQAQSLGTALFTSGEYAARNRDNTGFVTDLYYGYLQRPPDSGGMGYYLNQLNNQGVTREQVRAGFAASQEFQNRVGALCSSGGVGSSLPAPTGLVVTAMSGSQISLSWTTAAGAASYQLERSQSGTNFLAGQSWNTGVATSYADGSVANGTAYLYHVCSVDGVGNKSSCSNPVLAVATSFADDPLVAHTSQAAGTRIMAQHITDLRKAVNAVRVLAGQGTTGWTTMAADGSMPVGSPIHAKDVQELRDSLSLAMSSFGMTPVFTDPNLTPNPPSNYYVTVKRTHVQELRHLMGDPYQ